MGTYTYSTEEIGRLSKSPYVLRCTEKSITYTYAFKQQALEQHKQGFSPKEIWRKAGFDVNRWKKDYTRECVKNWKRIVEKNGPEGLNRPPGIAAGTPRTKGAASEDKIKRLELQVAYLKAENDFLAELRAKRAESNSGRKKNSR